MSMNDSSSDCADLSEVSYVYRLSFDSANDKLNEDKGRAKYMDVAIVMMSA